MVEPWWMVGSMVGTQGRVCLSCHNLAHISSLHPQIVFQLNKEQKPDGLIWVMSFRLKKKIVAA